MIRIMDDTMQRELLDWLQLDVPLHLPVIGDIVRYGLSANDQEVWVQCDAKGIWTALIRRFSEHYILCVPVSGGDMEELGCFLRLSDPLSISGASHVIRQVQSVLDDFSEEVAQQMILTDERCLEFPTDKKQLAGAGLEMGMATVGDAEEIGELIIDTDAFRRNFHSAGEVADGIRSRMVAGGVRHAVMRLNGRIVSHANTTAETIGFALVSGVTTRKEVQRQGHAGRLVSYLCRQLLSEGRKPCLFCKSPGARALYGKLGFAEIGEYVTLRRT